MSESSRKRQQRRDVADPIGAKVRKARRPRVKKAVEPMPTDTTRRIKYAMSMEGHQAGATRSAGDAQYLVLISGAWKRVSKRRFADRFGMSKCARRRDSRKVI